MTRALTLALLSLPLAAQVRSEYRAFWVDTFNTTLNNHADILAVIAGARAVKANALFVEIRRRGDAWYLNSIEPPPDFVPIQPGFDPLAGLIVEAHAVGIEVHAWVIMAAVWNKNPSFPSSSTLGPPLDPRHVFNRHGGYDPVSNTIAPGPENWLTRTLLPDGGSIGFQGHRFGNDFWLDFGHPAAAAYTVDVLLHLVRNYEIDGLHFDRVRYPEFSAAGVTQTPATGANIGYNFTSVDRFQRRYGISPGAPPPAPNDARWLQWRRDQVTNVVRRVYLNAIAIRPRLKVSASLIAFGGGPVTESAWASADAFWRVYQDWRAWTEEGILDLAVPMNYKREHAASEAAMFNQWAAWTATHQYQRAALIGQAVYLNAVEGSLRQTTRSLALPVAGVSFYSFANTNDAVAANPYSTPPNQNTPLRPFLDFAAAYTSSIFADPAVIPSLPWKIAPRFGHLMGFTLPPLDTAPVGILNLATGELRTVTTDGGGFYGAVDLAPGQYLVSVDAHHACTTRIDPGIVTTANLHHRAAPKPAPKPRLATCLTL